MRFHARRTSPTKPIRSLSEHPTNFYRQFSAIPRLDSPTAIIIVKLKEESKQTNIKNSSRGKNKRNLISQNFILNANGAARRGGFFNFNTQSDAYRLEPIARTKDTSLIATAAAKEYTQPGSRY